MGSEYKKKRKCNRQKKTQQIDMHVYYVKKGPNGGANSFYSVCLHAYKYVLCDSESISAVPDKR